MCNQYCLSVQSNISRPALEEKMVVSNFFDPLPPSLADAFVTLLVVTAEREESTW
jgi:hypothetical protein